MNLWHALIVYAAALVGDVTWAQWTLTVNKHQPLRAALWGAGIVALGVVSIDAYIDSRWYAIPVMLGAATGTYLTVRHAKRGSE